MKIKTIINRRLIFFFLVSLLVLPQLAFAQSSGGWSTGLSAAQGFGLPNQTITAIVTNLLKWILGLLGMIGIIGFVIAGIMYLLSFGDDDRMKLAKQAMYYCIIGIVVGLVGLVVITAVSAMLTGTAATF